MTRTKQPLVWFELATNLERRGKRSWMLFFCSEWGGWFVGKWRTKAEVLPYYRAALRAIKTDLPYGWPTLEDCLRVIRAAVAKTDQMMAVGKSGGAA